MTGIPKDIKDTSNEQIVALLEGLLDKATSGKLEYLCVVYQERESDKVTGWWRGTKTAQHAIDAAKGLKALAQKIFDHLTDPPTK
jgi:hypothetical protein